MHKITNLSPRTVRHTDGEVGVLFAVAQCELTMGVQMERVTSNFPSFFVPFEDINSLHKRISWPVTLRTDGQCRQRNVPSRKQSTLHNYPICSGLSLEKHSCTDCLTPECYCLTGWKVYRKI